MTNTATTQVPAADVAVGMGVVVGTRLATYHGRPELAGLTLAVKATTTYPSKSGTIVAITLDGLPETCSPADTMIEVAR